MEIELTKEDIIDYLGQPRKQENSELIFQCPICSSLGNDRKGNNLKYNLSKNVLYCFANDTHSKLILSEIYKKKRETMIQKNDDVPKHIKYQNDYIIYQSVCNAMLMGNTDIFNVYFDSGDVARLWESEEVADRLKSIVHSDKPSRARKYLEEKRGIITSTIDLVGLGVDFDGSKKWVLPIFNVLDQIAGFEYRGIDFDHKKVWKEKETPTCLVHVYGAYNSKKAIIAEGMLDCYILAQLSPDDTVIFSCSNGVQSTLGCLNEMQFSKYDKIELILDNDPAGEDATSKILAKYPFIIDKRDFLKNAGVKDVGDWWLATRK